MSNDKGSTANPSGGLNEDQLAALMARQDDGPVVMLNLLAFKADGGLDKYMEYSAAVAPLLAKVNGRVAFAGSPTELLIGSEGWDLLALIEYPKRADFLAMVGSPEYQAVAHLREEAITRSVLYAMDPVALG